MPVNYGYTENGVTYLFDDVFVPADAFRQGNLWFWGNNYQSADNTSIAKSTPVTTFAGGTNWKQVSTSSAIKTDGTLWIWGDNYYGDLGINVRAGTSSKSTPVTTFAGGTNWKQLSTAANHTAAIKTDGTLWLWGYNYGRLGDNTSSSWSLTPITTFSGGTDWKQVSAGRGHTAAIKTNGTLWVWGINTDGRLGTNDTSTNLIPVTTFAGGTNWKQVECGYNQTAAIKTDGTLWVWGQNYYYQLGTLDSNSKITPVTTFAGGTDWKQVSCGTYISAATKTDGTVWVWGSTNYGALGNNRAGGQSAATPITTFAGGTNWKQVSCESYHVAATKSDGTLWVWGYNDYGSLGINAGPTSHRSTPVTTFAGGSNWKQVTAGYSNTLAIQYIDDFV